jgi:hypothetical protein
MSESTTTASPMVEPGGGMPWWAKWLRNAIVLGIVASAGIHLLGGVAAMFIHFGGGGGGGGAAMKSGGGGVEMALMTEGELAAIAGGDLEDSAVAGAPMDALNVENNLEGPPGDSVTGGDAGGADSLGGLGGGGDVGGGVGIGGGTGGSGASFFGVEAKGDRIAFIVDVSGSMTGDRLQELKSQLNASIHEMPETSAFIVLPFSSDSEPLGGKLEWWDATAKNKLRSQKLIEELVANGGTRPRPAFEWLFRLRPRADVVFFMTDGAFEESNNQEAMVPYLLRSNRSPRVKIHCICFEESSSEDRMKQIAKDSGGTYTFVGRKP